MIRKKNAPKPVRRRCVAASRILLDRARLTIELPNYEAGRADRHDMDPHGAFVSGAAPRDFHVIAHLDPGDPFLWIGVDADPRVLEPKRTCFAVITGDDLRNLAEDVLRCFPSGDGGLR